jgi:diguanylate cyclase (GGDEF)-like protein
VNLSPFSYQLGARVAEALIAARSLSAALETLASEMFARLNTRVAVFERGRSSWHPVATAPAGETDRGWQRTLVRVPADSSTVCRVDDPESGAITVLALGQGPPDTVVVLEGDWMPVQDPLRAFGLVTSLALHSIREREERDLAERRLIGGYSMARRLSRLSSMEQVCQQVVDHVARLLEADRVSLALYNKNEDVLTIAATHGYPQSAVAEVRVPPGAWVIGHVFASGRPLFVNDVRLVRDMSQRPNSYRTFAFAAVPLVARREIVGVLTVTDKRDGRPFNRNDEMVLRGLAVTVALSIVAARSDSDAAELAYAATIDGQTGLMNRPSLDTRLHQEVERSKREGTPIAVLMADIDNFKQINDSHGHQVGDAVLRVVGGVIRSAVRVFDVCARYGGDEFAIVMPNCDQPNALACAERIRSRLADHQGIAGDGRPLPQLTLSIGVAVMGRDENADDLISRADRCLYQAKADGKNAVRSHALQLQSWPTPHDLGRRTAPVIHPHAVVEHEARLPTPPSPQRLPYVLVADQNDERVAICLQAVRPFQCGLLVARSGAQAAGLIESFGPPVALIVDLMLPSGDAFSAIDALVDRDPSATDVVAWSASREMREYAASRVGRIGARIISSAAPPATLAAAIDHTLQRRTTPPGTTVNLEAAQGEMMRLMTHLTQRVRAVCDVPGIAVYLREPDDEKRFRASFSWASDDPLPQSSVHLPDVFDRVRESGKAIVAGFNDRAGDSSRGADADAVRGVAGVPIWLKGTVAGVICVFDIKPLTLSAANIDALAVIGAGAFSVAHEEREAAPRPEPVPPLAARGDRSEDRGDRGAEAKIPTVLDWPPALLERSGGEFAVARELSRSRREGRQLSVVLFNVTPSGAAAALPDFPEANLDEVAETLLKAVRQSDLPIRWSVSELLVVLPGLGGTEARTVAERVRAALSAGSRHRLAVSGGVAEITHEERFLDVVDRARQKLAVAVSRGHNRIV